MSEPGLGAAWAGGWDEPGVLSVVIVESGSPGTGVFVYSGTPGPGTLIASTTAASADPFGNAIPAPGYTTYKNNAPAFFDWTATNFGAGNITVYTAASEAGPWTLVTGISITQSGALGPTWSVTLATSSSAVRFAGGVFGGIAASDPASLNARETWHDMTLLNSWSLGASGFAQYKLEPDNRVSIRGVNVIPGTVAGGTSIWTPPAGYVPAAVRQDIGIIVENGTEPFSADFPRFDAEPSGLLVQNLSALATRIGWNASYALD